MQRINFPEGINKVTSYFFFFAFNVHVCISKVLIQVLLMYKIVCFCVFKCNQDVLVKESLL